MTNRGVLLWVALGLIGLGMLTGIAALVLPAGSVPDELVGTILLTGVYTLGLLVVVTVSGRMTRLRTATVIAAVLSLTGYTLIIWFGGSLPWGASDWFGRVSTVLLIACFASVQRMILAPLRLRSTLGVVAQRTGLIAGGVSAVLLAAAMVFESWIFDLEELYLRVTGIGLILAAGGSIGAGLVWFFERRPEHDEPGLLGEGVPVALDCPRCAAPIAARSNREVRCAGCRLRVRVEVEEPRCVCGYLLYQLVGDTCPECGKAVAVEDRWQAPASGSSGPASGPIDGAWTTSPPHRPSPTPDSKPSP